MSNKLVNKLVMGNHCILFILEHTVVEWGLSLCRSRKKWYFNFKNLNLTFFTTIRGDFILRCPDCLWEVISVWIRARKTRHINTQESQSDKLDWWTHTDNLSLRFSVAGLVYIPITPIALNDLGGRPLLTLPERKKTHDGFIYDIRLLSNKSFVMPREIYENA